MLNVDLLGPAKVIPFTLFLPIPDNPPGEEELHAIRLQAEGPREELDDLDALRQEPIGFLDHVVAFF